MRIIIIKVIKLKTDDGLVEFKDEIKVGKEYAVDSDSKRWVGWFHVPTMTSVQRVSIRAINGKWFPIELFKIEEKI